MQLYLTRRVTQSSFPDLYSRDVGSTYVLFMYIRDAYRKIKFGEDDLEDMIEGKYRVVTPQNSGKIVDRLVWILKCINVYFYLLSQDKSVFL